MLLFGAALALRVAAVLSARGSLVLATAVGDEQVFLEWGRRVAAGELVAPGRLWQAPGAAWLLGGWMRLAGGSLVAARLLWALLGALTTVGVWDLGRRLAGSRVAFLSGWIYALYAPAIFIALRLGKAAPATLLLILALDLGVRARGAERARARFGWGLAAGLAMGAAALTREALLAGLLLLPALVAWRCDRRAALASLGGALLALVPLGLRNLAAGVDPWSYTANLGPNLWIGNHPGADGLYQAALPGRGAPPFERHDAQQLAEKALGHPLDGGQVSGYWRAQALDWIGAHPLAALGLCVKRAWLLLSDTEWMDSVSQEAFGKEVGWFALLAAVMRFGLLLPLALVGLTRRGELLRWILPPLVLILAAHLPFFVFGRFRAPALPLLALLAAGGLLELPRLPRGGVVVLLALGLAIAFVRPPRSAESPVATTYNNVGVRLAAEGDEARAREAFERALRADPGHANANFHLGESLAMAGELTAARPFLERAVRLAPLYGADVHLVLALAHARGGAAQEARAELAQALALGGEDAGVLHRAGKVLRELGETERARSLYLAALERDPGLAAAANDLGWLERLGGDLAAAREAFERALAADPYLKPALVNLAGLLASAPDERVRDGARALLLAERAARAGVSDAVALDLRAMALAELGRFQEASRVCERALESARAGGREAYAEAIEGRLALYRAAQPYRSG